MNLITIRAVYNLLTFAASIFLVPFFLLSKRGRIHFWERFGIWSKIPDEFIWFHAPSLGEIQGLIPIAETLKMIHPQIKMVVSVTSPTALESALKISEFARMLPFDSFLWIKNAINGKKIKAFVFAETEIWPELTKQFANAKVPMFLVNARVTEKSITRYSKFNLFFKDAFKALTAVCAVDKISAQRFASLGVDAAKIAVTGNAKYEKAPVVSNKETLKRSYFSIETFVLTVGSIRPGEEEFIFSTIEYLKSSKMSFCVVLAPRHREKFEYFACKLKERGIDFQRWTESKEEIRKNVFLLDTYGKLEEFYAISNIAVIGGTLNNFGGHNPLEPAPYKVFTCIGNSIDHIGDIAEKLIQEGAVYQIKNGEELSQLCAKMLENPKLFQSYGEKLYACWEGMQQAKDKIVKTVTAHL